MKSRRTRRADSPETSSGFSKFFGSLLTQGDLSRLGRNSSLTGLYINFTFPKYNVRYIAINDHFDTIDPNSTDSDIAGIKNWFNDNLA